MPCQNCGEKIHVSKSLQRGKTDSYPEECPNCGSELHKEDGSSNTLLNKGI